MSVHADTTSTVLERVSLFLSEEADYADRHAYSDWLNLWSPDAVYWVPLNLDDYDPARHVSIIYDDYERLTERCFRLSADGAHSQDPPSRLCRVIGNIRLVPNDDGGTDNVSVLANMVLVEVRWGHKSVYGARLQYTLVPHEATFRIKFKKVTLLDNDEPQGNLTFLL